ncbi:MAG: DsrE family protein [Chitinivibrionia bacterium]|nr:DsrE family protein [Chitinivibrionia bacterium]
MEQSLVIFLHSARYDRVFQAVNLLQTACAMGWRCHLFLFFDALASFMAGGWDEVDRPGDGTARPSAGGSAAPLGESLPPDLRRAFELSNNPSLYETLEAARKQGLTVCACSASARLLGLETQAVRKAAGEIVGLPTMLKIASEARHTFYI